MWAYSPARRRLTMATLVASTTNGNAASNAITETIVLQRIPVAVVRSVKPEARSARRCFRFAPPRSPRFTRACSRFRACSQSFAADATLDRFPYEYFRLVEPEMSMVHQVTTFRHRDNLIIPLPNYRTSFGPAVKPQRGVHRSRAGR